ncbi:MAG: hypothetical protein CMM46_09885 [Rhodospirillaceae bacterium]|nr:hypothetical protein [Rhodospirillaceae bacterium]|tara:strand:- start:5106 stop:6269 length:1164 start_codon:yes stop_codon:yes gene_type:complete
MPPTFAVFEQAEHHERLARARKAMRQAGLRACLCVGLENLYYLGGYDSWVGVNSPQAMIFTDGDDEPTLVMRNVDLPLAVETTWISDIRTYHLHLEDPAVLIADVIEEKGVAGEIIGIEAQATTLNWDLGRRLERAIAPSQLTDATTLLGDLRWIKSPTEIACIKQASSIAEAGLQAMRRHLRPGISEMALAAEVDDALRRAGSDFPSIPIELASGSRSEGGHGTPRGRRIESGDLVHAEFAGVSNRYHAVAIATMAAGEPDSEHRELHDVALASLRGGMAAIKPGVAVADVEEASLEPLCGSGMDRHAMMRFGYGIGVAYPPVWLETLQISRGIDQRLEPGMAFVLHACITPPGSGDGVILGGTWLMTQDGIELLVGAGDIDLVVT